MAVDRIIRETSGSLSRFAKMMEGLDTFCMHLGHDCPKREFAFAVAALADMIRRDAENIAAKVGKIEFGGHKQEQPSINQGPLVPPGGQGAGNGFGPAPLMRNQLVFTDY